LVNLGTDDYMSHHLNRVQFESDRSRWVG
jgi:hypothetical protein